MIFKLLKTRILTLVPRTLKKTIIISENYHSYKTGCMGLSESSLFSREFNIHFTRNGSQSVANEQDPFNKPYVVTHVSKSQRNDIDDFC